jgi:hypothetical protein
VLNPALLELAGRDRISEMQRASAERSLGARSRHASDTASSRRPPFSTRHPRLANPQRAIGWFLVSAGLRLVLPRTRTGSGR